MVGGLRGGPPAPASPPALAAVTSILLKRVRMLLLRPRTVVGALVLMGSCCAATNPECRLAAASLPRFKYETFYGWHATNGNFTNVGQSPSAKGLEEFFNATGKPGILELEGVFFTAATKPLRGMVMNPGAAAAWTTLAAEIKPLVDKKGAIRPVCAVDVSCAPRCTSLCLALLPQ